MQVLEVKQDHSEPAQQDQATNPAHDQQKGGQY